MRYGPAILVMTAIFLFSAGSAVQMPERLVGMVVNKGGHMAGYGLLALSYWRMFEFKVDRLWPAWLLAVCFALTDELHQSFVPGRHPSLFDALFFDALGAWIGLRLADHFLKSIRPSQQSQVAEDKI